MLFVPPYIRSKGTSLINTIKNLGLSSGLQLCLDAGDANSYSSGQKWLDLSGNGYDFFRGSDGTSQSSDPTHNGTPGGQSVSEYWSFDGGDYFTLDETNPTWVNNLHKDNATWGFCFWMYVASSLPSLAGLLFGNNRTNNSAVGVSAFLRSNGTLRIGSSSGGGTATVFNSTATASTSAWVFFAAGIDEGANSGFLQINATQEDISAAYSSPSTSAATYTLTLGDDNGGNAGPLPSGYRMQSGAMWESAMPSKSAMLSVYNVTKGKFGH